MYKAQSQLNTKQEKGLTFGNYGYIVHIMKKEILHFKMDRPKTRAHRVLFGDTPFKPKVVEDKFRYKRKPKHVKRDVWD